MRNIISSLIIDNLPNFIKNEYPTTANLLVDYYQWLELDNNFIDVLFNLSSNLEINDANCKYIDAILADLGWSTQKTNDFDKRLLVNTLKDFYMSRGSLNGLTYLFKLLFNTDVHVTYPRDRWFSLSDSEYFNDTKIIVSTNNYNNLIYQAMLKDDNLNAYIVGNSSGAKCLITKMDIIHTNIRYLELTINNPDKKFINETITIHYKNNEFIESLYERPNLIIKNGGKFYKEGDEILLHGYNVNGKITVKKVKRGSIHNALIVAGGIGYQKYETINTEKVLHGRNFLAMITSVDMNGTIEEISILNNGIDYIELPDLVVNTQLGTGANIVATTNDIGKILELQHELFYWDNITTPTLEIITDIGINAEFLINNNLYINSNRPKHRDDSKFIGHNCYLHDSNKFNRFSYEIRSEIPLSMSKRHVHEHIHPSGVNLYAIQDYYVETTLVNLDTFNDTTIDKTIVFDNKQYHGSTFLLNTLTTYTFNGNFNMADGNTTIIDLQANNNLDITIQDSEELIIDNLT
ncbi:MAG: hypothetical protein WC679_00885 [Bacteroidales bacterium]|jgi:hypothetical protein